MASGQGSQGRRKGSTSAPSKKWTVKELKQWIRERTGEVNKRINEYREYKTQAPMEKQIKSLQKKIGKAGRKGREILLGFEKRVGGKRVYKSKEELLSQARKLQSFIKSDVYSDISYTQLDEKAERARQTFNERFGYDLSESEYYNWVENMGTIGADAKGTFSYVTAGAVYAEARRSGVKVNLADIVEKANNKSKGKGWDKQRLTDEILSEIKNEVRRKASTKAYKQFVSNTGLADPTEIDLVD